MDASIANIVDKNLDYWISIGLNMKPGEVQPEMLDLSKDQNDGWKYWLPIDSKVTDEEINDFEKQIAYKLPQDFIAFLKHKHFYRLQISEASFCKHPVHVWRKSLSDMIFDSYPREYTIDKGFIPFAEWSDWGCLCFDTNNESPDYNYNVVLWDHEEADKFFDLIRYSKVKMDFKRLMIYLDKQDDETKKERT